MRASFVYSNDRIASSMNELGKTRARFGPFTVDLTTRELRKSGVRIKLGGQPFEILATLLECPGELVTRDQLRKRIWAEDTFVDFSHGLNAAVNKLREALSDSADDPRYIETLPRRGYRFIAKIDEPEGLPLQVAPPPSAVEDPVWKGPLLDDEWESTAPVKRRTLANLWVVVAVSLVLGLYGLRFSLATNDSGVRSAATEEARLHLARSLESGPSIWRLEVAHAAQPGASVRVTSSPETIAGPQPSPDGKKLVFMAGPNDSPQIWVSNLDGSSPQKLTHMGKAGTPRWSPDSRWIAFDSDGRYGQAGIYIVSAEGGTVRSLVDDGWNNSVPSWSRDGQWIYFASNRSSGMEEDQIWKIPVEGGQPARVTRLGGFSAYESLDGQSLYYAKTRQDNPEIWQVPVNGGNESRVSAILRPSTWAGWALTENGILFLSADNEKAPTLEFFDFATRGVRPLGMLEKASFWLSASQEGKSVWYSELTREQAQLVFRTNEN